MMTPPNSNDVVLAEKCLEMAQTLVTMGQNFRFSLKVGTSFNFSFSNMAPGNPVTVKEEGKKKNRKKRKSPSTIRRNAERKDNFIKKRGKLLQMRRIKKVEKLQLTLRRLSRVSPPFIPSLI